VRIRAGETTTLNVALEASALVGEEVVVTGSKRREKVLEAPVQVEALSADDIETSGGGTFLSAMSTLKGVDFARVGINGQSVSMRGFNNNFNTRLLQMKDGRVAQLPGTGLPQGNFLPTSEIQYNNSFGVGTGTLGFVTGAQARRFLPNSEGTFLADANNEDIDATELGAYLQLDYRPTDDLRINTAARLDDHSTYGTQFSPKAAIVYTVAPSHNVRVGYNRAFKSPTILNSHLFISAGDTPIFQGNSEGYTIRDAPSGGDVVRQIGALEPEEVNSLEVGYKGIIGDRLFVDVVGYNSWYTNFISPLTNVADPLGLPFLTGEPSGTWAFQDGSLVGEGTSFEGTLSTYFNFGSATVRGLDIGLRYAATEKLELSGNMSLIELSDFERGDANQSLLLNVPTTKVKGSVTVRDVGVDNYFVSASGRWKSAYTFRSGYWNSQTFYSDGEIPSRFTANLTAGYTANLTAGYTVPQTGVKLKASVTNLFDTNTPDVLGAPETGRLFWVSATYNFRGLDF
jgi:iron complex outermembrane receptor protein